MDTKKLRQRILDLAIRGKLVPQDPNDEPASILLERIHAEKERLIKEGKIKRSKKTATDDEIEAPFEIPESWKWARLCDITELIEDCPHSTAKDEGKGYPLIRTPNVGEGYLILDGVHRVSESVYNKRNARAVPQTDDIIYAREAPAGNAAVIKEDEIVCLGQRTVLIRPFKEFVNSKLLTYFIISPHSRNSLISTAVGSTATHVNLENIRPFCIPLPPLAEQQRIANEVERWFALIDELESNEGDLLKAIDQAKSKILDLAIHGKLVPQDPNDEPAIDLLKRINPKFEACDKEDIPFEIPQNWEWTTLGKIGNYGNTINVEIKNIPQDAWVLELEDLEKDTATILKRVTKTEREIKGVRHAFKKGDVLYSKLRTYLNKVLVAPEDGYCTTEIIPISFQSGIQSTYIIHVLRSRYFLDYTIQCGYGVKMPRLSTTDACKGLIPLPPFQEQLRIVAKIEELFTVLDGIKASLD